MTPGDAAHFTAAMAELDRKAEHNELDAWEVVTAISELFGFVEPDSYAHFAAMLAEDLSRDHFRLQARDPHKS